MGCSSWRKDFYLDSTSIGNVLNNAAGYRLIIHVTGFQRSASIIIELVFTPILTGLFRFVNFFPAPATLSRILQRATEDRTRFISPFAGLKASFIIWYSSSDSCRTFDGSISK